MARSAMPDSAGSQFFIVHEKSPHLDGEYATVGKIVEGMDIVDSIACTPVGFNDKPRTAQIIKSATVETFGEEYPEPNKL